MLELTVSRGQGSPIQQLEVFRAPVAPPRYGDHEVIDLVQGFPLSSPPRLDDREWLSVGNSWRIQFEPDGTENTESWSPEQLKSPHNFDPWFDVWLVEGPYATHDGKIVGFMYVLSDKEREMHNGMKYGMIGGWKQKNFPKVSLF